MAREVQYLDYFPEVLKEIKEIQTVAQIETPILEAMWQAVENILANQFVVSANSEGATRYEKMLKLNAPTTENIETRRFRLLTRYQEQAPYTYKVLRNLLDSLLGEGQYELTRNVAGKWLKVRIELTVRGQFEAVEMMLERITPQNMLLTVELRYNQWSLLKAKTWGELKAKTWGEMKEGVI